MGRQTSDPMGEVVFLATSYSTLEITAVLVRLYQSLNATWVTLYIHTEQISVSVYRHMETRNTCLLWIRFCHVGRESGAACRRVAICFARRLNPVCWERRTAQYCFDLLHEALVYQGINKRIDSRIEQDHYGGDSIGDIAWTVAGAIIVQ